MESMSVRMFNFHPKSLLSNTVKFTKVVMSTKIKIAAVQAEPVWNDLQGGVKKVISLIKEASSNGANVIGFPEVFIPGYPW